MPVQRLACLFLTVSVAFVSFSEEIVLTNGWSKCTVDTMGGRVLSYRIRDTELLWCSQSLGDTDTSWVHGGIPLAWPWFGRIGRGDESVHGYAWKSAFAVRSHASDKVVLALETESALLEYTVALEPTLTLQLRTINRSRYDLPIGQAFHPYFRVSERDAAVVEGVDISPLVVTNAIDRGVWFGKVVGSRVYRLRDNANGRVVCIEAMNSSGVNVWNPGVEKKCPGVIPGDEWRRFVAIEPYLRGENRFVVLKPGEQATLQMTVSLE